MIAISPLQPIHLCCTPVDMRKSIDGFCAIVRNHFNKDPLRDGVFVFVNKPGNKMKILIWDRHGYWLLYKRLEEGKFQMPPMENNSESISNELSIAYEQLVMIIEGIDLTSVKRRKRYIAPPIV